MNLAAKNEILFSIMKKYISRFFFTIFLIGAIIWMFLVISTTLLPTNNFIRPIVTSIFGLPEDFVAKPKIVTEVNSFDDWMYSDQFYLIYSFATVIVVAGLFTLTKGRNLIEKYMLLQAYALPRQREHWGKVIDHKTKKPIPFAVIRLVKADIAGSSNFISQTVADLDGRYRISLPKDKIDYQMEVSSPSYFVHKQIIKRTLLEGGDAIRLTIRLNKDGDSPQLNPLRLFLLQNRSTFLLILTVFIFLISLTTCFASIYSLIFHFNFVSIGDFIFYGFAAPWNIFVLLERKQIRPGKFINSITQQPIANVTVQIFLPENKAYSVLSDQNGMIKFDVDPGQYQAKITKVGFIHQNKDSQNTTISLNNDGYLKQDIYLTPLTSNADHDKSLPTPFG